NIWPEDPVPDKWTDCRECGLYAHGSRMVWGEGNPEGRILVVLDNPGAREDRDGNPFVCGTRATLQEAVHDAGLGVRDLYVTYILKRKPVRKYDKERIRQVCMMHLREQMAMKQPVLVVCLGNVAVRAFFHDQTADVKTLRGKWHIVRKHIVAVAYHPLA